MSDDTTGSSKLDTADADRFLRKDPTLWSEARALELAFVMDQAAHHSIPGATGAADMLRAAVAEVETIKKALAVASEAGRQDYAEVERLNKDHQEWLKADRNLLRETLEERDRLAAENATLRAAIKSGNDKWERLEREFYLTNEALASELRLARAVVEAASDIIEHARWLAARPMGDHVDFEPMHAFLRLYDKAIRGAKEGA